MANGTVVTFDYSMLVWFSSGSFEE